MKGDFSRFKFVPHEDHQGVLMQQGRVITDADWNEREAIDVNWRLTAGRDIIGAHVAAVPATEPDGYRVLSAAVDGDHVDLELGAGRIWADGLHTWLPGETPVARVAEYLPSPHNPPGTSTASIGPGVRDAVILEVSLEALNAFQDPTRLIEPALGGPDTTERVIPHAALKLLRLEPGEDCANIGHRLRDNLAGHGRLSVSLEPPTVVPSDCPVFEGGGYSGFEHNLYRIEVAAADGPDAMFKWSAFNAGLVGRGLFHGGADARVEITANRTAILSAGLTEFYLEALEYDEPRGHWQVVYGTLATLNADDELDLVEPPTFGTLPGASAPVFFRLWNGISTTSAFTNAANPVELRDGIRLVFDVAGNYRPGDYWTFNVRAGDIPNPEVLIDDEAPHGPHNRRVPLAELVWDANGETAEIEDCRRRFRPLANQKLCCTYVVGNGVTTFGDFNSLEEAAAHLPPQGGKICLLPGIHIANLALMNRRGVYIEGCRHRTFVLPRLATVAQPIITVRGGQDVSIAHVDFIAPFGVAVDVEGDAANELREVRILDCRMMALTHGVRVESVEDIRILENQIWLLDHPLASSAISLRALDAVIEKNRIGVWPFEWKPPGGEDDDEDEVPDPSDPCVEPDELFDNIDVILVYVKTVWAGSFTTPPSQPYRARGGIHVKGSSTRIDLRRNRITGGLGHGITLGGVVDAVDIDGVPEDGGPNIIESPQVSVIQGVFLAQMLDVDGLPMADFVVTLSGSAGTQSGTTNATGELQMKAESGVLSLGVEAGYGVASIQTTNFGANHVHLITVVEVEVETDIDAGFLTRIRIIENQIEQMGLSGIGFWFYDLVPDAGLVAPNLSVEGLTEFISLVLAPRELLGTVNIVRDLVIRENRIENNLRAVFTDALRATALFVAQGGISLGIVEGVRIEANHITGNGVSAVESCAGIFIGYGEEIQISGNHIAANGPVPERYRELRTQGLRSGIFIRMAASVVAGATGDGIHKPALLIRDNVIAQPAGRAITALAYGPVSLVGNTLNSDYEGAWSVIDELVGGVLIFNLGGIHRLLGAATVRANQDQQAALEQGDPASFLTLNQGQSAASRYQSRVEAMLPGGETLVNSNRVRTGPENRSWSSQLIVTADDLGFDGNQSGTYRPDVTFSNLIAIAHSLRVTDNRFRERAQAAFMSALTITGGATLVGGARAMNMTTANQGDHCIVAITQGAIPVEESMNQVVVNNFCPADGQNGRLNKRQFVIAALLLAWRASVQPGFQEEDGERALDFSMSKSLDATQQMQVGLQQQYRGEIYRQRQVLGPSHPSTKALEVQAEHQKARAQILAVQGELAQVKEAELPTEGTLVDGRVADSSGRAVQGQRVELVTRRGEPLDVEGQTDAAGYYALKLDAATTARLAERDDVFVRVSDKEGNVLSETPSKVVIGTDTRVREDIQLRAVAPIFSVERGTTATEVFRNGDLVNRRTPVEPTRDTGTTTGVVRPTRDPTPVEPVRNEPVVEPVTGRTTRVLRTPNEEVRVPLEDVRGIGDATAARLRRAGITDANDLVARPEAEVSPVLGRSTPQILAAAREAVQSAQRNG